MVPNGVFFRTNHDYIVGSIRKVDSDLFQAVDTRRVFAMHFHCDLRGEEM